MKNNPLKDKLLEKLDGRTADSFYQKHIKESCNIGYGTFMNQVDKRSTMRGDVKQQIQKFISAK